MISKAGNSGTSLKKFQDSDRDFLDFAPSGTGFDQSELLGGEPKDFLAIARRQETAISEPNI